MKFKVACTPKRSYQHVVYCSSSDAVRLGFEDGDAVLIGKRVMTIVPSSTVEDGSVALNATQRRDLRVSKDETITVAKVSDAPSPIVSLMLDVDYGYANQVGQIDVATCEQELKQLLNNRIVSSGQKIVIRHCSAEYMITVLWDDVDWGLVTAETKIFIQSATVDLIFEGGSHSNRLFRDTELNFQKLGIGGLDGEFSNIFRRAFASRLFPQAVIDKLGISHVKGMLLHGPPGTGKTLIARQIGKMLNAKEPKVVNGPEVLSKFVGETEKNVRDLFAAAEADQRMNKNNLHIIIFDEIDAICKARGSTSDGTGVHDSIVNQLLTKIDGVEALNNILLIGMTNRKDLLDEALLRPGRLEIQVEIGLPDEQGRMQILQIHTSKMRDNSFISNDVNLEEIASISKNFSGAEIEGLIKSATSFALTRQVNMGDLSVEVDEENIKVTMADFMQAFGEIRPSFGASRDSLDMHRINGMLDCGDKHKHIREMVTRLVEKTKTSAKTALLTCLLHGNPGSGKTALAATVGLESEFPFVKIVSAETMIGWTESRKCRGLAKVFEDAYRSPLSLIVLDDIERLIDYVSIGPRFSNAVLQMLLVLLKKLPPKGRKLMVVGTSSVFGVLESMDLVDVFNIVLHVPDLGPKDVKQVLQGLGVFHGKDIDKAVDALGEAIPIKRLLMLVEMAAHQGDENLSNDLNKIELEFFLQFGKLME